MKHTAVWQLLVLLLILPSFKALFLKAMKRDKRTSKGPCPNYFYKDIHGKCRLCELCKPEDYLNPSRSPNIVEKGCRGHQDFIYTSWCRMDTGIKPFCPKLQDVPYGKMQCQGDSKSLILPGTVCKLTCDQGYRPAQPTVTTQCDAVHASLSGGWDLKWSNKLPQCIFIPVTKPPFTTNATTMTNVTIATNVTIVTDDTNERTHFRLKYLGLIIPLSLLASLIPIYIVLRKCGPRCMNGGSSRRLTKIVINTDVESNNYCGNVGNDDNQLVGMDTVNYPGDDIEREDMQGNDQDSGLSSDLSNQDSGEEGSLLIIEVIDGEKTEDEGVEVHDEHFQGPTGVGHIKDNCSKLKDKRKPEEHDENGSTLLPNTADWTEGGGRLSDFLDNLGSLSSVTSVNSRLPVEEHFVASSEQFRNPVEDSYYSNQRLVTILSQKEFEDGSLPSVPSEEQRRCTLLAQGSYQSINSLQSRQPPSGTSNPCDIPMPKHQHGFLEEKWQQGEDFHDEGDETTRLKLLHSEDETEYLSQNLPVELKELLQYTAEDMDEDS